MIQAVGLKYGFWLMLLSALLSRFGVAVFVDRYVAQTPGRLCLIAGDAEGYWELAGKIAAREAYSIYDPPRRLLRMPGFPALLALPRFFYRNDSMAARFPARLLLAAVGVLACCLTYWLGRELCGEVIGLIASTYTVCSPTMCLFSVLFLSETVFAAAILGSLIAAAKLVQFLSSTSMPTGGGTTRLAFLTGLLIGLATYMRPTWLLVGPGIAVMIVLIGRNSFRTRLLPALWVCLGLVVAMSPWTVRNAFVTGHLIPTTLWSGPSLYDGLNPHATGDSDMTFFEKEKLLNSMSEYEMNREYEQRAWAYAYANPKHVMWLAFVKQLKYWNPVPNVAALQQKEDSSDPDVAMKSDEHSKRGADSVSAQSVNSAQLRGVLHVAVFAITWIAFLPLIVCSVAGAWFSRRDPWLLILTAAPIVYFAGLHLLFVGSLRYRIPAEYPLAVLAAVGLVRLCQRHGAVQSVNHVVLSDR